MGLVLRLGQACPMGGEGDGLGPATWVEACSIERKGGGLGFET